MESNELSMKITYLKGDATRPVGSGNKIIAHICNDIGAWGAGFVLAISRRWTKPKAEYQQAQGTGQFKLGSIQLVQVEKEIWVANLIAQRDIRPRNHLPPIRYVALSKCLTTLSIRAEELNATVHMPRIGCGLAGGNWQRIEPIIAECLSHQEVFVYDLVPGGSHIKV